MGITIWVDRQTGKELARVYRYRQRVAGAQRLWAYRVADPAFGKGMILWNTRVVRRDAMRRTWFLVNRMYGHIDVVVQG